MLISNYFIIIFSYFVLQITFDIEHQHMLLEKFDLINQKKIKQLEATKIIAKTCNI